MKRKATITGGNYQNYIAREDIKRGQVLRRLWVRFARPLKSKRDTRICGIALGDAKKGEQVATAVRGAAMGICDGRMRTSRG